MPEAAPSVSPSDLIDLQFPIIGRRVPIDHGYQLYGALCHAIPELHGQPWLGVHPLRGRQLTNGTLRLPDEAKLGLRLPAHCIPMVLPLAGRTLSLRTGPLVIGAPQLRALSPASCLDARLVYVKLTQLPRAPGGTIDKKSMQARFRDELLRQLEQLGVSAAIELCGRQQITIGGRRLLGWSVRLGKLNEEGSLRVQAHGLGGKRAMGCGLFLPTRGPS